MISKSCSARPFRNGADAASVGLNRQLRSRVPVLIGDAPV